jgi:hypothetical protein
MTRRVAILVAIALAATPSWGHSFPPVHSVVVQVERDSLAVLVGYRPGTGESTDRVVARVASQPSSRRLGALKDVMTAYALAPLTFTVDGTRLTPTSVEAKLGLDAGNGEPTIVLLVTYELPVAGQLAVTTRDPVGTRISWQDHESCRVDVVHAPAQDRWFEGVASFLLNLRPPCATSPRSAAASSSH